MKVYNCKTCGKEWPNSYQSEDCERKHYRKTCPHSEVTYGIEYDGYSDGEGYCLEEITIYSNCKNPKCRKCLGHVDLLEAEEDQDKLKAVYDLLKKVTP